LEARTALNTPAEKRTPEQVKLAAEADVKQQFSTGKLEKTIRPEDQKLYEELKKKVEAMEKTLPPRPQTWADYSPVTSPTKVEHIVSKGFYPLPYEPEKLKTMRAHMLSGGELERRGKPVDPGWPSVFGPTPEAVAQKGTRLALAQWMTDPRHPL